MVTSVDSRRVDRAMGVLSCRRRSWINRAKSLSSGIIRASCSRADKSRDASMGHWLESMGRRRMLPWALVGVAAAVAAWWWLVALVPTVTVIAAARGTAVEIVYATGAVEPVRWARVASIIRDRIVEICDCEGKVVDKGDVLARLDDR